MYYFADTFLELYSRYCQVALTVFADNAYVASDAKHSESIAFFRTGVILFKLENISDRDLRYLRHDDFLRSGVLTYASSTDSHYKTPFRRTHINVTIYYTTAFAECIYQNRIFTKKN